MTRLTLLTVLVAACGSLPPHRTARPAPASAPRPSEAPAPAPETVADAGAPQLDWTAIPLATPADQLAAWRLIRPTFGAWADGRVSLPDDAGKLHALALGLLTEGNFTCPRVSRPGGTCAPEAADFAEVPRTAGLDDPCLRRVIAQWALDQLDEDDVAAIPDVLLGLAALPEPEHDLVAAAFELLPEHADAMTLQLLEVAMRAGHVDEANQAVRWLSDAAQVVAATHLHVPAALAQLDDHTDHAVLLAIVGDPGWSTAVRLHAIEDLAGAGGKLPADVRRALLVAVQDSSCAVAAAAALHLTAAHAGAFAPSRPRGNDPAALTHALCVLARYPDAGGLLLRTYVDARGLATVTIAQTPWSDTDDDGNGDPHTVQTVDAIPRDELFGIAGADDEGDWRCAGDTCTTPTATVQFQFETRAGKRVLARLVRTELPLTTCAVPPSPRHLVEDPYRGKRVPL